MAPTQKPLKLPRQLLDQIGGEDALSSRRKFRSRPGTRKELRQVARAEKKSSRSAPPPAKRKKLQHSPDLEEIYEERSSQRNPPLAQAKPAPEPPRSDTKPKPILKKTRKADPVVSSRSDIESSSQKIPRRSKDKLADDDAEIAALEKKLGLKGKKKLPKSFTDDGLDMLLEGLGDEEESDTQDSKKRKAEGDEWLNRKRKAARKLATSQVTSKTEVSDESQSDASSGEDEGGESTDELDGTSDMSLDESAFSDDASENQYPVEGGDSLDEDDFDGFSSDEHDNKGHLAPRIRENPYIAPSTGAGPSQKYIPPSLRAPSSSDSETLVRLRRQTQGLVNRLTEANLISILGDIEKLYRDHPRQHVTSTLVDILLTSICEPTSLPDTLIILPAGFIAAIYKIIGMDFGAQVINSTVELFDEQYARASATDQTTSTSDISKETSNLIMLFSELYNFHVIGSNLIFDYIKIFLSQLSELNVELLLKVIRTSGPQLRQDDPSSLKEIVAMLRPAITNIGEENMSVRTKFMIETINDLKNNRMKTGGAASAVTSEHTTRMKKTLGTLNTRTIKASEPLRIGLNDIKDSDKRGKWWLVGASWSGNVAEAKTSSVADDTPRNSVPRVEDAETSDLLQLAREQRMNTDIRRAIFITIMSATDYEDAYLRLLKLRLKKVQEYEIPKVLIHCSGAEAAYNPYYTLIAKKVCGIRKLKTAFQYCLWDLFKAMGESDADDDDEAEGDETLDMRHVVNLAKMFATLIVEGAISLGVLKKLSWSYLQSKTKTFLEVLFVTLFLQSQKQSETKRDKDVVIAIFSKVKDMPHLMKGLQYFLKKAVNRTDITGVKEEKETIKWACSIARDTLEKMTIADTAVA